MKYIKQILSMVAFIVLFAMMAIHAPATETTSAIDEKSVMLSVKTMNCPSCPYIVKGSLDNVEGVTHSTVSLEDLTATVTFDPKLASVKMLTEATTAVGFPSTLVPSE